MRRGLRFLPAAALLSLAAGSLAAPTQAAAANPWTMALTPASLVQNVQTTVQATITDGSEMIGCIVLKVPPGFVVGTPSVASLPGGRQWNSSVSGSAPTMVTFVARTSADRLNSGGKAVFNVPVTATGSPLPAWSATAYKGLTVDTTQLAGSTQVQPRPFTITPAPTATPSKTATPTPPPTSPPTATATAPVVTPIPTPAQTGTPGPAATPTAQATPTQAGVTPRPSPTTSPTTGPSGSPSASGTPYIFPAPIAIVTGGTPPPPIPRQSGVSLDIGNLPAGGSVQLDGQAVGGMGMFAWAVPVAFLGLPGLVLILIVLAQAGFAWLFVPLSRRVLGMGRRRAVTRTGN